MSKFAPAATEISLRAVAETLGVHYMTAYRYVRLGRLPARKKGGQWWVRVSDLALLDETDDERPARGRARLDRYRVRLFRRMLDGDERGAWSLVESASAAGAPPDRVYLDLLAPVLREIGQRWATGDVSVGEEHQATAVATRLVGRLGPAFARRGRSRGFVVLGGAPGDRHSLPAAMLADILRGAGYGVIDLGADVPAESFVAAARAADPLLACAISVSTDSSADATRALAGELHLALPGVPVLIGGPAVTTPERALELGSEVYETDAAAVVRFLECRNPRAEGEVSAS
ncbi:MAG: helix-turn-helix domain-containing protein [Actinobacteria bacterium]|nr:helix-turn-helix domain-containing protein [Actinomycetota bacterium]